MRTSALRRCAPAFPFIRWHGNVFGLARAFARGVRSAQAVTVATPQSEGLVRVRGRVCLRTPAPVPFGSLPHQQSVPEGCRAPLRGGGGPVGRLLGRRAVRHRRSAGRGATARAPAACTTAAVSGRTAISCPATLEVNRPLADRHRERRKPPPNHGLPLERRQRPGRRPHASPPRRFPAGSHRPEPHIWRRRLLSAKFPLRRSCSPSLKGIE